MSKSILLPSTYLTVLSILENGSKYGYQINQILEERGYREWVDIQFSSIYKSLSELEKKGLIKGKKLQESIQPSKKIYSLTEEGKKVFVFNVFNYLSNSGRETNLFLLALSAINVLPKEEALKALAIHKNNLLKRMQFLDFNLETLSKMDYYKKTEPLRLIGKQPIASFHDEQSIPIIYALFDFPKRKVIAELNWIEEFINKIITDDVKIFKK